MAPESTRNSTEALSGLRIDRSKKTQDSGASAGGIGLGKLILIITVLFILAGGFGVYAGWINVEPLLARFQVPDAIRTKSEVRVVRPVIERRRAADASVVATGYLESRRQAKIGARAVGRVQSVFVEEGSKVKKDDVLAVLEHADLDASLAATEATLARSKAAIDEQNVLILQNKREYDRARDLLASRSISNTEYNKARYDFESAEARRKSMEAEVQLAEARLREAQQLKENMFIRAPFDGTVISKDAEVGESIMPGGMGEASGRGSAVTIADLEHLEADCDVKEDYIGRVRVGQHTEISVDAVPQRRYHGVVRKIIPMGDRARATIKVKVALTDIDDRLFPNMSSTVYFLTESDQDSQTENDKPRMFVPEDSIVTDSTETIVWVADEKDHAQRIKVSIGAKKDGRVEITSGLTGDERIIANPQKLSNNQPLKVSQ